MTAEADGGRPRVLVLTAAMGSGHLHVAAELTRRLRSAGASCETLDLVADTGPAGRRLQATYARLLRRAPWLYDAAMRTWARWPQPMERFTAVNAGPFEAAIARAADRGRPDVVVSTYNLASQCLGRLRARGRLRQPTVTVVIDAGVHPYWVSRHVDRHLAPLAETAAGLSALGAPGVSVVAPVLRPEVAETPARDEARAALGLPADARIVVVNGGSWAAGHVARTAERLATRHDLTVVVLCGRDEALAQRLGRRPRLVPVPWTTRSLAYLAAADVVVDNAGGVTCWEALALGRPVALFDPLPGHGRLNARTLHRSGLVTWLRSPAELLDHVDRLPPPARRPGGTDPAELILQTAGAVR